MSCKNDKTQSLVLYYTSACHLCEQAETVLQNSLVGSSFQFEKVDIVLDNALLERYGTLIPVLKKGSDSLSDYPVSNELHWPFDEQKLSIFLFSG